MFLKINLTDLREFNSTLADIVYRKTGFVNGNYNLDLSQFDASVQSMLSSYAKKVEADKVRYKQQIANAVARVKNHWVTQHGLLDNEANGKLIADFMREEEGNIYTVEGIDNAIENLRDELGWAKKMPNMGTTQPPAPAPAPTPEPVTPVAPVAPKVLLSDGSEQLPLDVDNATLKKATKAQARDWLDRARKNKRLGRGYHGVSL